MNSLLIVSSLALLTFALPNLNSHPGLVARQTLESPLIPSGWVALGCYTDSTASRTLRTSSTTSLSTMTLSSCIDFCTVHFGPYLYSGVEFGRECYCDNDIHSPGVLTDASGCNVACTGDDTQSCGGADRIYIAQRIDGATTTLTSTTSTSTTTTTPVSTPSQASIKHDVGTWEYQGCFNDDSEGPFRILLHEITVSSNSAEICTSACGANGYSLAGLEFAGECWCDTYLPFGEKRPDNECFMTCTGDPSELCGAGNRLALYVNSAATPPSSSTCLGSQNPGSPYSNRITGELYLMATDLKPGSTDLMIYADAPRPDPNVFPRDYVLSHCQTNCASLEANTLGFDNNNFLSFFRRSVDAQAPRVGETPVFSFFSGQFPYAGYCMQPNPQSPTGPFIGFPVLAVDGRSDLWSLCANNTQNGRLDVVYSPVAVHAHYELSECTNMYLQMVPKFALPPA